MEDQNKKRPSLLAFWVLTPFLLLVVIKYVAIDVLKPDMPRWVTGYLMSIAILAAGLLLYWVINKYRK